MIVTDRRKRIWLCLLLLNLAFIWGNSLLPGEVSGQLSRMVKDFVFRLLRLPAGEDEGGHGLLRKLAHFSEFAALGALLCWRAGMAKQKGLHLAALPLLGGMLVACVDETIQTLVPNRGPSVIDVWIDTFGVAVGIILVIVGYHLKKKRKNTNEHLEVIL